jgi:hypothetical protein
MKIGPDKMIKRLVPEGHSARELRSFPGKEEDNDHA